MSFIPPADCLRNIAERHKEQPWSRRARRLVGSLAPEEHSGIGIAAAACAALGIVDDDEKFELELAFLRFFYDGLQVLARTCHPN